MKIELTFNAVIDKNGKSKIIFDNRNYFDFMIGKFKDKEKVSVKIENRRSKRSLAQNSYWWGVCYKIIAETTGHTPEEIHEIMKIMFLPKKFILIKGIEFEISKSTAKLSVGEAVEYTDKIRNFASQELNANIPTPCEAGYFCGRKECPTCSETQTKETKLDYPVYEGEPIF